MADRYLKPLNENTIHWHILKKMSKILRRSFTSENFDAVAEDFQNLIQAKTSVDQVEKLRREERRIGEPINLFKTFSTLWSSSTDYSGVRSTVMLFHDILKALSQGFLIASLIVVIS